MQQENNPRLGRNAVAHGRRLRIPVIRVSKCVVLIPPTTIVLPLNLIFYQKSSDLCRLKPSQAKLLVKQEKLVNDAEVEQAIVEADTKAAEARKQALDPLATPNAHKARAAVEDAEFTAMHLKTPRTNGPRRLFELSLCKRR